VPLSGPEHIAEARRRPGRILGVLTGPARGSTATREHARRIVAGSSLGHRAGGPLEVMGRTSASASRVGVCRARATTRSGSMSPSVVGRALVCWDITGLLRCALSWSSPRSRRRLVLTPAKSTGPHPGARSHRPGPRRMSRHSTTRRLRALASSAGVAIARMHPHMLRPTYVTTMQMSGVAFDASFGSSGERWLPAQQRRDLLVGLVGCVLATRA